MKKVPNRTVKWAPRSLLELDTFLYSSGDFLQVKAHTEPLARCQMGGDGHARNKALVEGREPPRQPYPQPSPHVTCHVFTELFPSLLPSAQDVCHHFVLFFFLIKTDFIPGFNPATVTDPGSG